MKLIVRLFLNMMETFKKLKWKCLFIAFVNQLNFISYSKSVAKYHNEIDKQMKRSRFSFKFVSSFSIKCDRAYAPRGSSCTKLPNYKNTPINEKNIYSHITFAL